MSTVCTVYLLRIGYAYSPRLYCSEVLYHTSHGLQKLLIQLRSIFMFLYEIQIQVLVIIIIIICLRSPLAAHYRKNY